MKKERTMTVVTDEEPKTELIKRTPVEGTPFVVIETEGKAFGTFGQYKITEDFKTVPEVEDELMPITWNRITQIATIVAEIITNYKK